MRKEFKYVKPDVDESKESPDENGITESMIDFSWERDVKPGVSSVHPELINETFR